MAQFDLHQTVTNQIIASIEAGAPAWRKPWTGEAGGAPFPLRANGEAYHGNKRMIFKAATEAQKAADLLLAARTPAEERVAA